MARKTALFTVVALSAGVYLWQGAGDREPARPETVSAAGIESPNQNPGATAAIEFVALEVQGPVADLEEPDLNDPRTRDYFSRLRASSAYKNYFREIAEQDTDEQTRLAEELLRDIDAKARKGFISEPEGVFLKLALMKQVMPEDEFRHYAQNLIAESKALAVAAETDRKTRSDPRFDAYKAREAKIVQEILSMESYPDGLSRSQYLRRRLDEARNEIYRD